MPPLSAYFPLTRIIHLPERLDRFREVSAELVKLGMTLEPGKVEIYPAKRPDGPAGFPSIGARGCFLSHLAVLEDARQRGVESVLVMEDDLQVASEDLPRIPHLLEQAKTRTWQFLYLGHLLEARAGAVPELVEEKGVVRATHFYAVHVSILDRLIGYLRACLNRPPGDPVGGPMHVDGAFSMFRAANPDVVTLVALPSLAAQRSSRSDISPKLLDRLPGLQRGAHLARGLVRAVRSAG